MAFSVCCLRRDFAAAGAFDDDEVPFGFTEKSCALCLGVQSSGAVVCEIAPEETGGTPHFQLPTHKQAAGRLSEVFAFYWQELEAPDGRPYYYDHVSRTWTFAKPSRPSMVFDSIRPDDGHGATVTGATAAQQGASDGDASSAAGSGDVRSRLLGVLRCPHRSQAGAFLSDGGSAPDAQGGGGDPPPGSCVCEYCGKVLADEWAREQHVTSMAGRRGHPALPEQLQQEQRQPANQREHPPDAEMDVEVVESDQQYWFNPRTRARAWSRDQLVAANREFYAGISYTQVAPGNVGPNGEGFCWVRAARGSEPQLSAWTLEQLHSQWRPDASGG